MHLFNNFPDSVGIHFIYYKQIGWRWAYKLVFRKGCKKNGNNNRTWSLATLLSIGNELRTRLMISLASFLLLNRLERLFEIWRNSFRQGKRQFDETQFDDAIENRVHLDKKEARSSEDRDDLTTEVTCYRKRPFH